MSKKTLKRSLALGAFMAFVITGSVWAEESLSANQTVGGISNHDGVTIAGFSSEKSWKLNDYELWINKATPNGAVWINGYDFTGSEQSVLKIEADEGEEIVSGLANSGNVDVGKLIIKVDGNAIGAYSTTTIKANEISITSTGGCSVYTEGSANLSITPKKQLEIIGAEVAVRGHAGSSVTIASDTNGTDKADINITGNIDTLGNGKVDVKLETASSKFKGAVVRWDDQASDGERIKLTLDNKATWDITGNSAITELAGNDAQIKNATDGDVTLTVNNANWDSSKSGATNTVIKDSTVNLTGVDLVLNSAYNTASYSEGVIRNTTINSDSVVEINQTGKDNAIGNGRNTIIAEEIILYSEKGSAIYAQEGSDCVTTLTAKEITLTSNYGGYTAAGVYTASGATVNINGFEELNVYSNCDVVNEGAYGITSNNSTVVIEGSKNIESTVYIESDGHSALSAIYGGKLTVNADNIDVSTEKFRNDDSAYKSGVIAVRDNSELIINVNKEFSITDNQKRTDGNVTNAIKVTDGSLTINSEADTVIDIEGNIKQTAGVIDLELKNDKSSVIGTINTVTEDADIAFKNNAVWNNTGNSDVAKLTLDEGIIKQTDSSNKIEVNTLVGKGTLKVVDTTAGQMVVGNDTGYSLTVATETDDSNTQETLEALSKVAVLANDADKSAATQVQLKNAIYDNVVGNVTDEGVKIAEKQVASANVSVNDMVAIGMMSWRAEMNDMNKRMGELRNANGEHGVWVRMVRGESEYNSVKNQYNQYQLGYDEKLSVDKRWTVGVALSYTDAENNFAQGNGESTNKAFSVYGSKLNDDGTFIDLIAKYARLENDFTVQGGQGDADYDTNAYSFSAEVGKRIQQGKGLWIEPQVELTYGKVSAVDYVTKNDVKVAQDGMESLVGRIGFSLGKDIEKGNVYARASYLYDFDGETKATLNNDAVLENDLGGGWWEVGVGANINLSKATYIYADVEKTFGGEVDTNWQWNLGVRYSF